MNDTTNKKQVQRYDVVMTSDYLALLKEKEALEKKLAEETKLHKAQASGHEVTHGKMQVLADALRKIGQDEDAPPSVMMQIANDALASISLGGLRASVKMKIKSGVR